jgi:hypothetical protein
MKLFNGIINFINGDLEIKNPVDILHDGDIEQ